MAKNKPNTLKTEPAKSLLNTAQQMAQEGYVSMPTRKLFGSKVDTAGSHWKGVYNNLLGISPDGNSVSVSATSPVGAEIPVSSGTKNLGYMSWGPGNRHPNQIAMLVSMLPYTAVGVKFNTDVIAGLGPKPKYRFNRYVNGGVQTESIDYSAAGALLEGNLYDKRKALFDFLGTMPEGPTDMQKEIARQMEAQLTEEIKAAEEALNTWRTTNKEVQKFMQDSNLDLVNTHLASDMSHYGICFPELQLDKQASNPDDTTWTPKIIGINHHGCCTTRLERMDKQNRINYVYVSNAWLDSSVKDVDDSNIAAIPALDPYRPVESLSEKIRNTRIRAYNGQKNANGKYKSERPTHFVLPCYYPSPGRPYYPDVAWQSILKGDVYKYTSTIIENRAIAKENSNSAGKIIYIHTEYLAKLYMQEKVEKVEDKHNLRDQMWQEINQFLQDKQNNGQTILSFTFIGSDGKEHDAWRIVDVPINSVNEAEANKTELEELSNVIFLALGIHSVLIGNSIGSSSSGGTQQREMYELKKLLSVPTQRLILKPYYVARDFNGWDSHLEWEIGQMTLTTLDRNKNGMEETKV